MILESPRLRLTLESTEAVIARIDAMPAADRAEVSPEWIERMRTATPSPWTHFFALTEIASGANIGACGFKGPPDDAGMVEIAYGIEPEHRRRGYATEAATALVEFATSSGARLVRAHTKPENEPSERVLSAAGFECVGEVMDPEDGLVRRWERCVEAPDRVA